MKKITIVLSMLVVMIAFSTPSEAQRERQSESKWLIGPISLEVDDVIRINMLAVVNTVIDGSLEFFQRDGLRIASGAIFWDDNPPVEVLYFDSSNPVPDPSEGRVGIGFEDGIISLTDPNVQQPIFAEIKTNLIPGETFNIPVTQVLVPTVEINGESVISALPIPLP